MSIEKVSNRNVVTLFIDKNVLDVAKLMKEENVGDVVIIDDNNQPVGIITD